MKDAKNKERERDDTRRTPELYEAEERPQGPAGSDDSWKSVLGLRGLVWGTSTLLFVGWCIIALGIGVNYAHTFWDWLPILAFGVAVPAGILWQANRVLASQQELPMRPSASDREKELLTAFSESGELTAVTAAMRTSLTADEAAKMLDGLAGKGHLRMRVDGGMQVYTLPEPGRLEMPQGPTDMIHAVPEPECVGQYQPLKEDLSERELEVLALLASGRTNSEIAKDLFVAHGTVKAHVANIYRKLDTSNRAEALSRARELKLLP